MTASVRGAAGALALLVLLAAPPVVAQPAAPAAGTPITVTGTVEVTPVEASEVLELVIGEDDRLRVAMDSTGRQLKLYTGKVVTATGVVRETADGRRTMNVTRFEVVGG